MKRAVRAKACSPFEGRPHFIAGSGGEEGRALDCVKGGSPSGPVPGPDTSIGSAEDSEEVLHLVLRPSFQEPFLIRRDWNMNVGGIGRQGEGPGSEVERGVCELP